MSDPGVPRGPECVLRCRALVSEQLPTRKQQLYETYGPVGPTPLIPEAQPAAVRLLLGRSGALVTGKQQQFVEVVNPNDFAVDVSGWTVSGDIAMTLAPGEGACKGRVCCLILPCEMRLGS